MPRFVILEHDHPMRHWDFMLEVGDTLRTWRLAAPPVVGQTIPAESSFDHRLLYLDYEGPVSGNRGTVTQWDAGTFEWIHNEMQRIVAAMAGSRLRGRITLVRKSEGDWSLNVQAGD